MNWLDPLGIHLEYWCFLVSFFAVAFVPIYVKWADWRDDRRWGVKGNKAPPPPPVPEPERLPLVAITTTLSMAGPPQGHRGEKDESSRGRPAFERLADEELF